MIPLPSPLDLADTAEEGSPRPPRDPAFPLPDWDRYRWIRFLGQGGMGKVFLARDPRLHREVAIKLVRGDAPDAIRRLLTEARSQARVSHERVCKVYEVGEVAGEVYIAMQFIDGPTLAEIAPTLSVEQTAMVLRDAALGVHEAHRAGILHRDIKPSNIMVERGEDGALRPYVMDFGLARSFQSPGATETGAVLGTLNYMAPEQARGEVGRLDRRADVYSLGASLYHLLTGELPIPGSNGLEVLNNIGTVEPKAPRAVEPDIPVDLEAIVMKCLEKERSGRYDSALALAEDLDRFLRGEPVGARRAGAWYRLRKRLQKHRRLAAAAGVSLALIAGALGWGLKARSEAAERERLARRFTEQVEHIEAAARYSALSPLHDIRGDQRAIRAKMDALGAEIQKGGEAAEGPGSYALGRGYLALGEDGKAREQLEAAWEHGFREPREAYALALVMGHLYQEKLREAERIEDKGAREAKKREIEGRFRDPALGYLKQSAGAEVPSREYVAALVSFYEGRLEEALGLLDEIGEGLPWFYEAKELRGDILEARAERCLSRADRPGARADFDAARRAYLAAAAIGQSVPEVHQALGELEYAEMLMELYGQGEVLPPFERGVAAASRALQISTEHVASLVLDARLHRRLAEHRMSRGEKVDDLLARAIGSAQSALRLAPTRAECRLELGRSYWQWGNVREERQEDPSEQLQKAIEMFEGVGPEARDYEYHRQVGLIFDTWADHESQIGKDARPNRARAITSFLTATGIDEHLPNAWINLGTSYFARATQAHPDDVDGDLDRAEAALDKARARNPDNPVSCFYGAEVHAQRARRRRDHGGDARPDLVAALELDRKGIAINPRLPHLHNSTGAILLLLAREAWDRGGNPDPLLEQARAAFELAITVAPEQGFGYHNLGEMLALRVDFQRARGDDPGPAGRAALTAIQKAIERLPAQAAPWANLGMVHSILADFELRQGRDPRPGLEAASSALKMALKWDPNDAQSHRYLGEVRATLALLQARKGRALGEGFEEARASFQKALDQEPDNQDLRVAFGQFCRRWAAAQKDLGQDPGPSLQRGLGLASEVLAARPTWPEARALRASLLLLEAEVASTPEERGAIGSRALDDFTSALGDNPNLERMFRAEASRAREISTAPR